ncbi:MAG: NADH-quinone oxidoreductase subunit NuoG [Anaerolineales bacterium]
MTNSVTLTIDNIPVTVTAGTVVVDAAKMAGIDIPVFCHHPKMEPAGMCRMCLVEIGRPKIDRATRQPVLDDDGSPVIQFGPKLETGCTVQVSEGMVVRGCTEKAANARKDILEFLLTSHPLDCPICDKGGECPLQNLTIAHGSGNGRFLYEDKIRFDKHVPLGDLIFLDRERCIQCIRCIRFQRDIAGDPVIDFFHRGRRTGIITCSDPGFDSYWSGNTTDICPVGALTTADFRFGARPWELNAAASLCTQCPVGCNITLNTRREAKTGGGFVIKRVMPRQNEQVNEIWICDKGRFSTYHYTESDDRLTQPLMRMNGELTPVTWGEALDRVAENLIQAGRGTVTLASGRLSNEDLFTLRALAQHLGGQAVLDTHVGGGDLVAKVGAGKGTNLSDFGKGDAILVVASDLEEEAPLWWLRVKQAAERGAALIVANPRQTKLDQAAAHTIRYQYGDELSALEKLPGEFANAENALILYGSEGLGLAGSTALAQACANLLISTGHTGKPNNGLIAVHPRANDQGAWDMGFRPVHDLKDALSKAKAAYIVGADPYGDNPAPRTPALSEVEGSHNAPFLVVQELFLTETAKLADVVLPAQAFTERDGSYTSGERRVQRFYRAVPALPGARADYAITAQIAGRLGLELEGRSAPRIFDNIAEALPDYAGLTYIHLAQTEAQWPIVGRDDLYYGGTTYKNSQGIGVQLGSRADESHPEEVVVSGGSAAASKQSAPLGTGLIAVPITRLYDQGSLIRQSGVLQPRLNRPHVVLHPADAGNLGIEAGAAIHVRAKGLSATVAAQLDKSVPQGVVLVPRSMGLAINGPSVAKVESVISNW